MMPQIVTRSNLNEFEQLELPDQDEQVMPGIYWGRFDRLFTPAYWSAQVWQATNGNNDWDFRIGNSIAEEIVACSLGGYGIPAEVGLAAFHRVRDCGLLSYPPPSEKALGEVLSEPLKIQDRTVHYRFVNQRSRYLSLILEKLFNEDIPISDSNALRNWLIRLPGIGLKTASWITRNWLDSDSVAILDIHVIRAGNIVGIFCPTELPSKNYLTMEEKFLSFAQKIRVQPSKLDTLIWSQMRAAGKVAIRAANRSVEYTNCHFNNILN